MTRTRDHTPVEELLQSGAILEEDLRNHPLRNSVSRCLGVAPRFPKFSFDEAELRTDDILLLCSDGLWSALPEEDLTKTSAYGDFERTINQLTDQAEMASYPHSDNISLVGLRWLSADDPHKPRPKPRSKRPVNNEPPDEKDPIQQAIDDIHRAMLEYAAEMKKD